jgi:hypothetical protein
VYLASSGLVRTAGGVRKGALGRIADGHGMARQARCVMIEVWHCLARSREAWQAWSDKAWLVALSIGRAGSGRRGPAWRGDRGAA